MADIGIRFDGDDLVLTKRRDFKWTFENLSPAGDPTPYPAGELYFELDTGGEHNALQEVKVLEASGGTYSLGLDGEPTDPIDYYDATVNPHGIHGDVTDALEQLTNVGAGNVLVHPAKLYPAWRIDLTLNAGNNEFQTIIFDGTSGGTFPLRFAGVNTTQIAYGSSALAVESALEALPAISPGDVGVTEIAGGYRVEFKGALAGSDVQQIVIPPDLLNLTGTNPTVKVSTTSTGSGALTEPIVNLINKYTNDLFNLFDSLVGVDIDFVVNSALNATLTVTSLKSFDEVSLITFAVDVTANLIEQFFNLTPELTGLFDTIHVDFYWNHHFQVEFIGELANTTQPKLTADTTLLTGLNGDERVEVEVLADGKPRIDKWPFIIDGSIASIKIESDVVDKIDPKARVRWQLVFLPAGEPAGGDPIALGRVSVQE